MRNYLSLLAGVLLAAGIFAQEIEEVENDAVDLSAETENVADIEVISLDTAVNTKSVKIVKTEYMIGMPKEENGFSGGIGFGIYSFNMSPVRRLIKVRENEELLDDTSNTLRISDYNFLNKVSKKETVPTFRAVFYGINETKFHVGGLLEVGGRTWQIPNENRDTVVTMGFIVAKAGVIMEQVLLHNDKNYLALGATLGGGAAGVGFFSRKGTVAFRETSGNSRGWNENDDDWENDYDDDYDDIFGEKMLGAASGFVFLDVNLTYILSVTKRFHLRFDAICDIMGSKGGYNMLGDDYGIVNPGGAFNMIWGAKQ